MLWVPGAPQAIEWLEYAAVDSPLSAIKVKNEQNCTSTPPVCLHSMYRDNFTNTFFILSSSQLHWFLQALLVENKFTFVSDRFIMNETGSYLLIWALFLDQVQ
jgi:hypothetical protein